ASGNVVEILGQLPFDVSDEHVEQTLITYTEEAPLQQSGTDLAFLNRVARENNLEFWIEYDPVRGPFSEGAEVTITEKWHFRSSPQRPGARMMNEAPLSEGALQELVSADLTIPLLAGGDEHVLQ